MQVEYDAQADIFRVLLNDAVIEESDEAEPGIIVDYDAEGNVVGVEVLDASKRIKAQKPEAESA